MSGTISRIGPGRISTRTQHVSLKRPCQLRGVDGTLPAGHYRIESNYVVAANSTDPDRTLVNTVIYVRREGVQYAFEIDPVDLLRCMNKTQHI